MPDDKDGLTPGLASEARRVAVVIVATMLLWLAAQWAGPALGLPGSMAFLFDFAALAALAWAVVVTLRMRRKSRTADRTPPR